MQKLAVRRIRHINRILRVKHLTDRIGEILIDVAIPAAAHVHIYDHHAVLVQMILNQCKNSTDDIWKGIVIS